MTAEQQLAAHFKRLHDDFGFFLAEIWRLKPPPTLPEPHWVQYDIAHWLQHGPSRRGIRGTRGLSKTWTTCAYIVWRLFRDPVREKVILCSATPKNSKESLLMIRVWIENIPFLRHLMPKKNDKWRDSAESLDVGPCIPEKAPSIAAVGFLGALSGTRATLIIPDDVEQDNNTETRAARILLDKRSEEFDHIVLEHGDICYLGTDHHEESLYEKLEAKGYAFRSWPIRYPTQTDEARIPGLAPAITARLEANSAKRGDPIWPERWPEEEIAEAQRRGTHTFLMQRMLIRGLADEEKYPLKLADFMVFGAMHRDIAPVTVVWGMRDGDGSTAVEDIPSVGFGNDQFYRPAMIDKRDWVPYQGSKAYLDPAGKGADEMAWAGVSQLNGYLFAKNVDGVHGGATQENLEKIVLSLRDNMIRELFVESNFGGEYLVPLIEPVIRRHCLKAGENELFPGGWTCAVQGIPSSGMKEARIIDNIAPPMQAHRVVISCKVASDQKLMRQLTRLKRERGCLEHDDRIEALAGAVALFKDFLHQDTYTTGERYKREQKEELLKRLAKRRGQHLPRPCWNPH